MGTHYSIKDLENLTGIKAHTIRIWEQRYNIIQPSRTDSNIRYYDSNDLKHMLNISLLNNNGVKISKIAEMSREEVCKAVIEIINKNKGNYADQIAGLTVSMIDLNELQFEQIINENISSIGFEDTMLNIIYPFLARVGFLWQTEAINPAQEHFITNLIRQKLIVAIDAQKAQPLPDAKKFVLYLPEGELHEISLLFSQYLIKSRRLKSVYLGQSLPTDDLEKVYEIHQPDYLLTVITSSPNEPAEVEAYLNNLAKKFPNVQILVSGYQVVGQDLELLDNITIITQFKYLIEFLEEQLLLGKKILK
ncbi:MAG: MerR family transcriptional regulator [Flammeovirgaceae bacterium]